AADLGLDLSRSWMVGDILHDIEAGTRAGCRTVLLLRGSETEWQLGPLRIPTLLAPDLATAADAILAADRAISRPIPLASPAPDCAISRPIPLPSPDRGERTPDGSSPPARA
ncbi:MAG TPA: HAD hydrolase-like protein, partial [Nannocystis sp.]